MQYCLESVDMSQHAKEGAGPQKSRRGPGTWDSTNQKQSRTHNCATIGWNARPRPGLTLQNWGWGREAICWTLNGWRACYTFTFIFRAFSRRLYPNGTYNTFCWIDSKSELTKRYKWSKYYQHGNHKYIHTFSSRAKKNKHFIVGVYCTEAGEGEGEEEEQGGEVLHVSEFCCFCCDFCLSCSWMMSSSSRRSFARTTWRERETHTHNQLLITIMLPNTVTYISSDLNQCNVSAITHRRRDTWNSVKSGILNE